MADQQPEADGEPDGHQPGQPAAVEARSDGRSPGAVSGVNEMKRGWKGWRTSTKSVWCGAAEQRRDEEHQARHHQPARQAHADPPVRRAKTGATPSKASGWKRDGDAKQQRREVDAPARCLRKRLQSATGQPRPPAPRRHTILGVAPEHRPRSPTAESAHQAPSASRLALAEASRQRATASMANSTVEASRIATGPTTNQRLRGSTAAVEMGDRPTSCPRPSTGTSTNSSAGGDVNAPCADVDLAEAAVQDRRGGVGQAPQIARRRPTVTLARREGQNERTGYRPTTEDDRAHGRDALAQPQRPRRSAHSDARSIGPSIAPT